jgi:hypothetical protein
VEREPPRRVDRAKRVRRTFEARSAIMPGMREDDGYDDQDNAEAFDEANLDDREQVGEMRTFEEMPDLFDATRAYGDRDDDEGRSIDAADFNEDEFDEDSLEEDDELDYRAAADDFE